MDTPPTAAQAKADAKQKELAEVRAKREVKVLPRTAAFTEHSIQKVLERIQTDRLNDKVVEWMRLEMAKVGHPLGKRARAAAILKAWREQYGYVEDPFDAEYIAKTVDVMCLPGHDYCFMGGDCDECVISTLSEMLAAGLQVALIVVTFRPGTDKEQQHVMGAVMTEEGWVRFDPSYFNELGQVITVDKNGKHIPRRERWIDVMTGTDLHRGNGSTTPKDGVATEVMLAARPNLEYVGISGVSLGAGVADQAAGPAYQAFGSYLAAADKAMGAAVESAKSAIAALQDTRDTLKLPQYDPDGSNGWTAALATAFYGKLTDVVATLHQYAGEVLAGKRNVAFDESGGSIVIVQNPGDKLAFAVDPNGTLLIKDLASGGDWNPGLGVAPVLVVALVAGAVVVQSVAVYLTVAKLCETYQSHAAAVAQTDTAKAFADMKKNGATPEEVKAVASAIEKSTATIAKPSSASENLLELGKTIMTGLIVVAGVGAALFVADKAFTIYEERRKRLSAA